MFTIIILIKVIIHVIYCFCTGFSLNIVFFQELSKVCNISLASARLPSVGQPHAFTIVTQFDVLNFPKYLIRKMKKNLHSYFAIMGASIKYFFFSKNNNFFQLLPKLKYLSICTFCPPRFLLIYIIEEIAHGILEKCGIIIRYHN